MHGRGEKECVALPHKTNETAAWEAEEKKKRSAKRRTEGKINKKKRRKRLEENILKFKPGVEIKILWQ